MKEYKTMIRLYYYTLILKRTFIKGAMMNCNILYLFSIQLYPTDVNLVILLIVMNF